MKQDEIKQQIGIFKSFRSPLSVKEWAETQSLQLLEYVAIEQRRIIAALIRECSKTPIIEYAYEKLNAVLDVMCDKVDQEVEKRLKKFRKFNFLTTHICPKCNYTVPGDYDMDQRDIEILSLEREVERLKKQLEESQKSGAT